MSDKPIAGIVLFGDPILRKKSKPIEKIDQTVKDLIERMRILLILSKGIGLAAPQAKAGIRLFLIEEKILTGKTGIKIFINPEIIEKTGSEVDEEGCLSLPGINGNVARAKHVKLTAYDLDLKPFIMDIEGLYARAVQHEIDHLDGILIIDHFGPLKRRLIARRLRNIARGEHKQKHA